MVEKKFKIGDRIRLNPRGITVKILDINEMGWVWFGEYYTHNNIQPMEPFLSTEDRMRKIVHIIISFNRYGVPPITFSELNKLTNNELNCLHKVSDEFSVNEIINDEDEFYGTALSNPF